MHGADLNRWKKAEKWTLPRTVMSPNPIPRLTLSRAIRREMREAHYKRYLAEKSATPPGTESAITQDDILLATLYRTS